MIDMINRNDFVDMSEMDRILLQLEFISLLEMKRKNRNWELCRKIIERRRNVRVYFFLIHYYL